MRSYFLHSFYVKSHLYNENNQELKNTAFHLETNKKNYTSMATILMSF